LVLSGEDLGFANIAFHKERGRFRVQDWVQMRMHKYWSQGDPLIKAYYQELFAGKYYVNSWAGWRTVVTGYLKNRLTDSRDVLPALSGISSRLQCEELGAFYAGLWEKELIHGLFWYTRVSTAISTPIYTGPSFS
jgi:hypothetical protein